MGRSGDFCFVHAADLHLDTPFKGLGATAPHVAAALREASLRAFDDLVSLCLARRAAFLVIAGDVYDGAERGLRAQLRFARGVERLADAGIATFVVHGNHDPLEEGWSAIGRFPPAVHIFGHEEVESLPVTYEGEVIATVHGISYGKRDVSENLVKRFLGRRGAGLQVGVLHCNVAGVSDAHLPYSPCSLGDLLEVGFDYWALGHIHSRTILSGKPHGDESYVVYSGNLQARSPKPSELGAKGATVVSVEAGRVARLEEVACDRVRFGLLEVDVSSCDGAADVAAELAETAAEELARSDGRSLVLRARLSGRGPAHDELARAGARAELLEALRDQQSHGEPFVWWDRVDDETMPATAVEELRQRDDFVADLLSVADGLAADGLDGDAMRELTQRMPRELAVRVSEMLAEETDAGELCRSSVVAALDLLGTAP